MFLFVSAGGGEKGGTEELLSQSLSGILHSWKFPLLCFGGDDLAPPAFELFGKVVLTPLSYMLWDGNKDFILNVYCQPLHPVLDTSCILYEVFEALQPKTRVTCSLKTMIFNLQVTTPF